MKYPSNDIRARVAPQL